VKPETPVVKGFEDLERVYAKDQPEYIPLPCLPVNETDGTGTIIERWSFTWRERLAIFFGRDLFVQVMTFEKPLQPIHLSIEPPKVSREVSREKLVDVACTD